MKKIATLAALVIAMGATGTVAASARSHEKAPAAHASRSTNATEGSLGYANNRYRAPVGANPYTHDLPSTDGSDR